MPGITTAHAAPDVLAPTEAYTSIFPQSALTYFKGLDRGPKLFSILPSSERLYSLYFSLLGSLWSRQSEGVNYLLIFMRWDFLGREFTALVGGHLGYTPHSLLWGLITCLSQGLGGVS